MLIDAMTQRIKATTFLRIQQHGIATLITLFALVIMIIAALALMRSSDTSAVIAGNIAFRRDLTNEAQRVIPVVNALFTTGALSGGPLAAARTTDLPTSNYWAQNQTKNPSNNNQGLPDALLDDSLFAGAAANDIVDATSQITIRYIIDRMCNGQGVATDQTCVASTVTTDSGGTAGIAKAGGAFLPAYRISIRISGPRNTQAFVQATAQVN
jgi:type IV pilus assembly protein PilX